MTNVRFAGWAVAVLAAAALGFGGTHKVLHKRAPHEQPIQFSHKAHLTGDNRLECTDCHFGAAREARAGLPSLETCLECHMKPQGKRVSEQAVRELAAKGGAVKWTLLTRNAGHVYFSHRMHVTVARMPCDTCHGDMSELSKPPTSVDQRLLSMSSCMDCHRQHNANLGCRACHH
jgi:hypothetical protein